MKKTGLEAVQAIHAALTKAGFPRTSEMGGADHRGWTTSLGSTGYSVRQLDDGTLDWHVVISGKPHLAYREFREIQSNQVQDLHEPLNPEKLFAPIKKVFESLGLSVKEVRNSGHQMKWDDDVEYSLATAHPDWLEAAPAAPAPISRNRLRYGAWR